MPDSATPLSPRLFFETIKSCHKTSALKAAIDLGLFTDYPDILSNAGFRNARLHPLPPTAQSAVIARA